MRAPSLLIAALLLGAAGPPADPDWPCVQRLVPTLTPGTLWGGHDPAGDWRQDPGVVAIVRATSPRGVSAEAAAAKLSAYASTLPIPERSEKLAELFAGMVDETNAQRSVIIDRLRTITRRQRLLADTSSRVSAELAALPADTPAAQRTEVAQRRVLINREYEEVERTIRYACEAPVAMEAKLGTLARSLQSSLE